ncbi:MAG: hypothetical protein HFH94_01245 [Lachnospiraceae bacterium]|nr:hypothetical protein [uncultured Acetatifactor sp.]MCI9218359.1 hypothetical protein [Lachnospiraceae bacterium]
MEKGILFPKSKKTIKENPKTFCFADVQESNMWDRNKSSKSYRKQKMVSHKQATHLDAIIQDVILKYF